MFQQDFNNKKEGIKVRYFKEILEDGLTYKKALKRAKKLGQAITRPNDWDGIHIEVDGIYKILLSNGNVLYNPEEIYDTHRKIKDWAVVVPTERAVKRLNIV